MDILFRRLPTSRTRSLLWCQYPSDHYKPNILEQGMNLKAENMYYKLGKWCKEHGRS